MCGIAGILAIQLPGTTPDHLTLIPEAWLDLLEASIAHRGPDGRGRFRDRAARPDGASVEVAFVHRRLSILDHSGGAQPMLASLGPSAPSSALLLRGTTGASAHYEPHPAHDLLAVVFNGCIYNHRELRRELQAGGHRFASDHSDTEVLLHGSRADGPRLPERLDGMYAYAVWSHAAASLTLARDHAGEKPLYLTRFTLTSEGPTFIAFCSVPAGLIELRRAACVAVEPDPLGITLWLKHGYWPRLPVRDLIEAQPGACYAINASSPWPPQPSARVTLPPPSSRLDQRSLSALLAHAVDSRLDADVPVGCFLSGGVDSSIIAALAQRSLQARGQRLRTFNVRMPNAALDESRFARAVADHLGTDHAELDCAPSAAEDLVNLIGQLGLPFGDSSLLPTHWVSATAREHVTVALGGDGGDELFAGYRRHRASALLHQLHGPLAALRALPDWLRTPRPGTTTERVINAARYAGYDDLATIFSSPQLHALLGGDGGRSALDAEYNGRQPPADARRDDYSRYLPCDLMRKVDTASMAVALEVRAPFLERTLAGAALGTPLGEIDAGAGSKGLLRLFARTLVPAIAIDRPKAGFAIPLARWFRADYAGLRTLLLDTLARPGCFDGLGIEVRRSSVQTLIDEHLAGRRDHAQRLYILLVMALWTNNTLRGT